MFDPIRHCIEEINSECEQLLNSLVRIESSLLPAVFAQVLKETDWDGRTLRAILRRYGSDATVSAAEPEILFDQGPLETFLEHLPGDSVRPEPLPSTFGPSPVGKCTDPITDEQLMALSNDQIAKWLAAHRRKEPVTSPVTSQRTILAPEITGTVSTSNGSARRSAQLDKLVRDIQPVAQP
jgi:hypothetical protein